METICYNLRCKFNTSKGGTVQMSKETQFKKEVQDRKRNYQDKKIELISRLCAEKTSIKNEPLKK